MTGKQKTPATFKEPNLPTQEEKQQPIAPSKAKASGLSALKAELQAMRAELADLRVEAQATRAAAEAMSSELTSLRTELQATLDAATQQITQQSLTRRQWQEIDQDKENEGDPGHPFAPAKMTEEDEEDAPGHPVFPVLAEDEEDDEAVEPTRASGQSQQPTRRVLFSLPEHGKDQGPEPILFPDTPQRRRREVKP